jgi:dTDP-4-amino-4,6-dideoxygalactose transaminase
MDGLQGAVLSVKLRHLSEWNAARRNNAALYNSLLKDVHNGALTLPYEAGYAKHVYHLYALRVVDRDDLIAGLGEKGVHCGIHYPIPIHLTEAYRYLGLEEGSFPVAETCAAEFVSLPMYPELEESHIQYVVRKLNALVDNRRSEETFRDDMSFRVRGTC